MNIIISVVTGQPRHGITCVFLCARCPLERATSADLRLSHATDRRASGWVAVRFARIPWDLVLELKKFFTTTATIGTLTPQGIRIVCNFRVEVFRSACITKTTAHRCDAPTAVAASKAQQLGVQLALTCCYRRKTFCYILILEWSTIQHVENFLQ